MTLNIIEFPSRSDVPTVGVSPGVPAGVIQAAHHVAGHLAVDVVAGRRPQPVTLWYWEETRVGFMCHERRSRGKDVVLRALAGPAAHALLLWDADGADVPNLLTEWQTHRPTELSHPVTGISLDGYFTSAVRHGGYNDYSESEFHFPSVEDAEYQHDKYGDEKPLREACLWIASRWDGVQRLASALLPPADGIVRALSWKDARDMMNDRNV